MRAEDGLVRAEQYAMIHEHLNHLFAGNFYMNHLLKNEAENIKQKGYFATCLGDMRNSFVCSNDMGEVAAAVLLQGPERHADRYYDITGPTPQSMYEV